MPGSSQSLRCIGVSSSVLPSAPDRKNSSMTTPIRHIATLCCSEESGTQYDKTGTYDETRAGARLVLRYDHEQDAFVGAVTNDIGDVLDQVHVEVHLSSGVELGPTSLGDLQPGETKDVALSADDESFDTWGAHPEVGADEHGETGDE